MTLLSAEPRPKVAIEDVAVVDVERGEVLRPRTVMIVDGLITEIGEPGKIQIPSETVRVNGKDQFLIPGLVDMHVHLFNNASHRPPNDWAFPLFIANGITGVREMACRPMDLAAVNQWRTEVTRGDLKAPHILATGVVVGGKSPDDAR
jgi:cytosine/adenosine deaminase-related metal-dependent hydrolase